jgi:DNA-binding transcriptional ArsR family regulator
VAASSNLGGQATVDTRRQVARLGLRCLVEIVSIATQTFGRDFAAGLTYLAVRRGNQERFSQTWRPGASVHEPPDAALDPVSARAVAQVLDTPYETVRAHLRKLRRMGVTTSRPNGAVVHAAIYDGRLSPGGLRACLAAQALVDGAAGARPTPPQAASAVRPDVAPQVMRLLNGFILDSVAMVRRHLQLSSLDGVIYASVCALAVRTLSLDDSAAETYGPLGATPGDDLRDPVSVYAVAKRLSMPYETVRRVIARLATLGLLTRTRARGGYIAPAEVLASAKMIDLIGEFADFTSAFVRRLDETGVRPGEP